MWNENLFIEVQDKIGKNQDCDDILPTIIDRYIINRRIIPLICCDKEIDCDE
jgi:hypothetical protein